MIEAVNFLVVKGQKFKSREDQYKVKDKMPDTLVLERLIVRHRITKERLVMKVIRTDAQDEL